jgi:tetratricopeptide (TPR) repeat protein
MRKYTRLFLLGVFASFLAKAGNTQIDSLEGLLPKARSDSERTVLLSLLTRQYLNTGAYSRSMSASREVYSLSEKLHWKKGMADAMSNMGVAQWYLGNLGEALRYYYAALKTREQIGDKKGTAACYNNIALIYKRQSNFPEALKYNFLALEMEQSLHDSEGVGYSWNNIGNIYLIQGDFPKALEFLSKALELRKKLGDLYLVAATYNNIGNVYIEMKDYDRALEQHRLALGLRRKEDDREGIESSYLNIGDILYREKKFAEAKKYFNDALTLARQLGDKEGLRDIFLDLSEADSATGNFRDAVSNYENYLLYRDSLVNEETTRKTVQAQMEYEFGKKHAADSILNAEKEHREKMRHEEESRQQNIYTYGGIAVFFLMFLIAGLLLRAYREKRRDNLVITQQKEMVEMKQKEILDSIHYAQRIQKAMMPRERSVNRNIQRLLK